VDGQHYDSHNILAPVTNDVAIQFVLTLMIMALLFVDFRGLIDPPGRIIVKYGDACDKTLTNDGKGEVIPFGEGF
jgi:hypothetical protein